MSKRAPAENPIHDLIADRWSPSVFSAEAIAPKDVRSLLEAARWAPSSFNEQPWRFVVGVRDDDGAWQGILDCLVDANQTWARHAPVLMLSIARTSFKLNDKPNRHALYDVGQATAHLAIQATALGLCVHQMAGFSVDAARGRFAVPEGHEPVACMAIGRLGDPGSADADLVRRDGAPRARLGIDEFASGSVWGEFPDILRDG